MITIDFASNGFRTEIDNAVSKGDKFRVLIRSDNTHRQRAGSELKQVLSGKSSKNLLKNILDKVRMVDLHYFLGRVLMEEKWSLTYLEGEDLEIVASPHKEETGSS